MSRMIEKLSHWQQSAGKDGASAFGYDVTDSTTKRRPPSGQTHGEDAVLPIAGRSKVQSSARDLSRNFALTGWMIRRHTDYIVPHSFHSRSGDDVFDREFEAAVEEWSAPENCDFSGRFHLCEFVRLAEACATLDGDFGALKLDTGHLQGIESDRLRDPEKKTPEWFNGVKVVNGRPVAYSIWGRGDGGKGFKPEREVAAESLYLHGNFGRVDQYRGISTLVSGLTSIQDTHEGISLALAKLKVEQLFALAFYRSATDAAGEIDDSAAVDTDGEETDRAGYKVDFGKGPVSLDLEPGDRAEFLHANSPGSDTQAFLLNVIMVALKSLDIPYSFYDEKHTNFFGSRAAWLHYERSCKPKRARVRMFLDHWTRWRTQIAVRAGLRIPPALSLAKPWWEWVPEGMPWWDPAKEIKGDTAAIAGGFSTPQRVVRERGGGDFFKNIDDTARAIEYARSKGLTLSYDAEGLAKLKPAAPSAATAIEAKPEATDEEKSEDETQSDQ